MDDFFENERINKLEVKKVMKTLLSDVDKIATKEKEKKVNWVVGVISHLISLISYGSIGKLEAFRKISMLLKLVATLKLDSVPIIRDLLYSLKAAFDRKFSVRFDLFGMLDGLFYGASGGTSILFDDISAEKLMKNEEIKDMLYDSFLWHSQLKTADEGKQVLSESMEQLKGFLEDENEYKNDKALEEYYFHPSKVNQDVSISGAVSSHIKRKENGLLEDNPSINFTV